MKLLILALGIALGVVIALWLTFWRSGAEPTDSGRIQWTATDGWTVDGEPVGV